MFPHSNAVTLIDFPITLTNEHRKHTELVPGEGEELYYGA